MAHTGIFATSDEILVKAGKDYNSTDITEARINALCTQAEAVINASVRYNWSDNYAAANADAKGILSMAGSNLVAMYIILYDMSSYPSRTDAEDKLNVLRDGYMQAISILRDKKTEVWMQNA